MPTTDAAPPRRLAVRLTPDALRRVRAGHPWVFDESVVSAPTDGTPRPRSGDLAVIFDDRRRFAGIGLYDPDSPIRVKMLHHGAPLTIDTEFWRRRLTMAWQRRADPAADLLRGGHTTGFRWVHGENDGLPGLIIDVYGSTAVVKVYTAAWARHLADILGIVTNPTAEPSGSLTSGWPMFDSVVLRTGRAAAAHLPAPLTDGFALSGDVPDGPVLFRELGLTFEADVVHGQKTGYFLDQRDNRALVRSLARDRSVLDVFCATGGFSVHAAAGGARSVLSVDLSAPTLAAAARNMAHNQHLDAVQRCEHRTIQADAFDALATLAASRSDSSRFDVVVVDPPSFAQRRVDIPGALRAYERLTTAALGVVRRGGVLVQASCSSRVGVDDFMAAVNRGAQRAGYDLNVQRVTGHPVDHPIGFDGKTFVEGAYLKAVVARPTRLASARPASGGR